MLQKYSRRLSSPKVIKTPHVKEDLIDPQTKRIDYRELMAFRIHQEDYDFVIETANAQGEHKTYDILRRRYGWGGKYVTINPGDSLEKHLEEPSEVQGFSPIIGDGIDSDLLIRIIKQHKPKNPVYIVNMAIGIMLSYRTNQWIPELKNREDSFLANNDCPLALRRMAEIWGDNLTRTPINNLMMSDFIALGSREIHTPSISDYRESGLFASWGGVNRLMYSILMNKFNQKGWHVSEEDINSFEGEPYREVLTKIKR